MVAAWCMWVPSLMFTEGATLRPFIPMTEAGDTTSKTQRNAIVMTLYEWIPRTGVADTCQTHYVQVGAYA